MYKLQNKKNTEIMEILHAQFTITGIPLTESDRFSIVSLENVQLV